MLKKTKRLYQIWTKYDWAKANVKTSNYSKMNEAKKYQKMTMQIFYNKRKVKV